MFYVPLVNTTDVAGCSINRVMSDESEQRQRLIWAREKAGYPTAKAAAAAFGWGGSTYSAHENGQNKLKIETARRYATAFRVSLCWLLAGEGKPNGEPHELAGLWERLSEPQRLRVVAFAEGILADQPAPAPPSPQPPPVAPSNMVHPRFKEQPELPTIKSRRAPHVYLQEWLDSRHWEPEQLARRIPEADTADIEALLSGDEPYTQDWLWYISKAFRISMESLYGPPPQAERKPAKRDGKKAAKR